MSLKKKVDLTPIWDVAPIGKNKVVKEKPIKIKQFSSFNRYRDSVIYYTELNKHLIEGIEKRGIKSYHVDHKISVKWGFENNIPTKYIGHIDNLQMLWWKDNLDKKASCFIDEQNEWIIKL